MSACLVFPPLSYTYLTSHILLETSCNHFHFTGTLTFMWDLKAICPKTAPAFPHLTSVFTSDFTWFRPHAHTCSDFHLESYLLSNTSHLGSSFSCKMSQRCYVTHKTNSPSISLTFHIPCLMSHILCAHLTLHASSLTLYWSYFQAAGWGQLRFTWWIPLTQHPLILHLLAPHQNPSAPLIPITTAHPPYLIPSVTHPLLC